MLTPERIEELGRVLEKLMARHPEADRETVWRILRDLEETPGRATQMSSTTWTLRYFQETALNCFVNTRRAGPAT